MISFSFRRQSLANAGLKITKENKNLHTFNFITKILYSLCIFISLRHIHTQICHPMFGGEISIFTNSNAKEHILEIFFSSGKFKNNFNELIQWLVCIKINWKLFQHISSFQSSFLWNQKNNYEKQKKIIQVIG